MQSMQEMRGIAAIKGSRDSIEQRQKTYLYKVYCPTRATNFAICSFLLRDFGRGSQSGQVLLEQLQREYRVNVCGPSTAGSTS